MRETRAYKQLLKHCFVNSYTVSLNIASDVFLIADTCGQRKMFADASEPETLSPSHDSLTSSDGDSESGGDRIVNGVPSSLGRWPWQGVLEYNTQIGGCAAVLLDSRWAVTAAHCVRGYALLFAR